MKSKRSIPIILSLTAILAGGGGLLWLMEKKALSGSSVGNGNQTARWRSGFFPDAKEERRVAAPRDRQDEEQPQPQEDYETLRRMVMDDPRHAGRLALEQGRSAVTVVATAWAGMDPDAAIEWAFSLEGENREAALAALATELASVNPQRAAEVALAMVDGQDRNETVASVMAQWAAQHPTEGLQWTRELDDTALRAAVERRLLPAVASSDPEAAAHYVAVEMNDPALRAVVVSEILQRWVQVDASAAASWLADFPDGELRQHSLDSFLRVWVVQDVEGLKTWWKDQPPGAFRTEVAVAMAGILAATDRPSALAYADSVSEPNLRATAYQKANAP